MVIAMRKNILNLLVVVMLFTGCGISSSEKNVISDNGNFLDKSAAEYTGENESDKLTDNELGLEVEAVTGEYGKESVDNEDTEEPKELQVEAPSQVSLIMVGDILLHTSVEESAKREDGSFNYHAIFENVKEEIAEADLALVNQEVIIGGVELGVSGYPAFNAPYEIGDCLVDVGFDVICHGTNHALDKGRSGLNNCLDFWANNYPDIAVLGINNSVESQNDIYIYEREGIKIAILNYTYGTNGIAMPQDMPYAVDMLDDDRVCADIKKAEEEADFTIVCPHWGTEYNLGVSSEQEKWTQIFLENGVDLVIGTHPHVIEPIELLMDENTGHEMLVYYSLGNFVNWTSGTGEGVANRMVGGMAKVTLAEAETGEVYIQDWGVEPLICHVESGQDGVRVYAMNEYTQELADENEIVKQDSNFSLEYCENLCEQIWGKDITR